MNRSGPSLAVDGHVHLHPCFPVHDFLHHAGRNLSGARAGAGLPASGEAALLFTESAGTERFAELRASAGSDAGTGGWGWGIERTEEEESLRAVFTDGGPRSGGAGRPLSGGDRRPLSGGGRRLPSGGSRRPRFPSPQDAPGSRSLLLVAGRQVVVEERLEVLALCTARRFPDGASLAETLARVREAGGVPVIPWGFGKWWTRRGERVAGAMDESGPGELLLGDNGGRPRRSPAPRLFAAARERGIPVLAGSDPLPFPDQVRRVGSYASLLPGPALDPERPARDLRTRLRELRPPVPAVGARSSLSAFGWTQLRLRLPTG